MWSKPKAETRSRLDREINEYLHSWDPELGRPHHIMDKMWQMMQSNDTKTMNLDKDFEEMVSKAKQTGLNGSTKNNTVLGRRRGTRSVIKFVYAQIRRWSALRTLLPNGSPFRR